MSLLWINGQLVDKADARVSPFDHGFLYGDGVWEPLRVFGGTLFQPQDHLNQLFRAAETLSIDIPLSRDELTAAIEATVRANNRTDGYIRVIVTRGPGTIGPDPRKIDPQVVIIAEEYQPFPAELYAHGLHVVTDALEHRVSTMNPATRVRTLARLDWVQARQHALKNGCLEAVRTYGNDYVEGCTEGALGFVSDGVVKLVLGHPHEVTGRVVCEITDELEQDCVGWELTQCHQLLTADEVFLHGTSCGIIGIVRINDRVIGSGTEGPITRAIRERYHTLTRGG